MTSVLLFACPECGVAVIPGAVQGNSLAAFRCPIPLCGGTVKQAADAVQSSEKHHDSVVASLAGFDEGDEC